MLKRPILIILLGYITGIIIGLYCKNSMALFVVIAVLLYIILKDYTLKVKRYYKVFCLKKAVIVFIISMVISNVITIKQNYSYENKYKNIGEAEFIAIIESAPKLKKYYTQYKIKIESINKDKIYNNTSLYLNLKGNLNIKYGTIISFRGEFIAPEVQRNFKGFNYKEYLKSIGIYGTIKADNVKEIGTKDLGIIKKLANNASIKIKETIKEHIQNEESRNLLVGILIGDDNELSKSVKEDFQNSSLSHILAVSGMHVSFVIMFVTVALSKLNSPKKISKIICISFLVFFIFLTGETPSVKRACIMAILQLVAQLIYRKSDTITNLSVSLLLILIANPFSIMDISLILSFSATCGIIFFYDTIFTFVNRKINSNSNKVITKVNEIVSISISAQILIFPLSMILFNTISLTFLFSNLLISTFIGLIIILGFISIIIPQEFLFKILEILLNILLKTADMFSKISISHISVITPSLITVFSYYLIIFVFTYLHLTRKKAVKRQIEKKILTIVDKFKSLIWIYKKMLIIILIIILSLIQLIKLIPHDLKIHFIDVGQGDACLIVTPKNKTILIDGGGSKNNEEFDVGKSTLFPYLLDRKITKIDYMMISHFDVDHCQALLYVLERMKVENIIIGKQFEICENYKEFVRLAKNKKITIHMVEAEQKINIEKDISFNILWPNSEEIVRDNSINNNSLVCKLIYKNFSMLFTGDIEEIAEKKILQEYNNTNILKSTILKVAHHGSKSSSQEEFIKEVQPQIALIRGGKKQ